MNRIPLLLLIPILMTISVSGQSPLVYGTNEFTFDFYHTSILKTDGNVLISPLSISIALGMIYPGAENNTAAEMKKTLHFLKKLDNQNLQYQSLVNSLSGPKSPLIVTNMAWLNQGTRYKSDFLDIQKKYFHSSFREVDFSDYEKTRNLNREVSESLPRYFQTPRNGPCCS